MHRPWYQYFTHATVCLLGVSVGARVVELFCIRKYRFYTKVSCTCTLVHVVCTCMSCIT